MTEHYLDNAATTKPCTASVNAVMRCFSEHYGNPSSLHRAGLAAQQEADHARAVISAALGCETREIIFTSCATESTNMALRSTAAAYGRKRKKIITSAVEHASVKKVLASLSENEGFEIAEIKPCETGEYRAEDFLSACDDNTVMVSMMMVNNETGHVLPVMRTFSMIKKKYPHIITHCDAVQAFMKYPVKVRSLCADFISISGHKIHAPKGIGALYVRKSTKIRPLILGGKQENGLRAGTESVPLIAGFGAAVEELASTIDKRFEYVKKLNTELRKKLSELEGVRILSPESASPYILSIIVPGIRSEIMLHYLEARGIYVSSGSACSKGAGSGVPEIFGASQKEADSVLRISFSAENTSEDIDALSEGIAAGQREIIHK
ncbi:MAG: cysteine desulfurase family protein [Oscillospiraceae bacterium]|nr:cysteine desulfurase family protein [Oscillospiraceae bacterium]